VPLGADSFPLIGVNPSWHPAAGEALVPGLFLRLRVRASWPALVAIARWRLPRIVSPILRWTYCNDYSWAYRIRQNCVSESTIRHPGDRKPAWPLPDSSTISLTKVEKSETGAGFHNCGSLHCQRIRGLARSPVQGPGEVTLRGPVQVIRTGAGWAAAGEGIRSRARGDATFMTCPAGTHESSEPT
jgi:hypothetical protein